MHPILRRILGLSRLCMEPLAETSNNGMEDYDALD